MQINGWQRLWLFASTLWALAILAVSGILRTDGALAVPSADMALSVVPPLFTALQEQLGLQLRSATAPVRVLVVDHIERPTEH